MVEPLCRDRFGTFTVGVFQIWTCSLCYKYLFPNSSDDPLASLSSSGPPLSIDHPAMSVVLPSTMEEVIPDLNNVTAVHKVCSWLKKDRCSRWLTCCQAAVECCHSQLKNLITKRIGQLANGNRSGSLTSSDRMTTRNFTDREPGNGEATGEDRELKPKRFNFLFNVTDVASEQDWDPNARADGYGRTVSREEGEGDKGLFCPQTWDGFSCVDATPAGVKAMIQCPSYLDQADQAASGYRLCTESGTWWTDPSTGQEWTDYTSCVQLHGYHALYIAGVVCNTVSLLFLIPACAIFLCYRSLRKQHRIRIHLNLFFSFLLTSGSSLLWENLVYRDRLLNTAHSSNMHRDSLGCRILYVTTRYAWTVAFFWMFLEGLHLYRLISRAFQAPRTIRGYYIFGWVLTVMKLTDRFLEAGVGHTDSMVHGSLRDLKGASIGPVLFYTSVRVALGHEACWVKNAGYFEWLIYGPELLCIIVNVFFLVGILRILTSELQNHPNEPSNFRRALKATFLLVPLFGLQLFLVSYSPMEPLDNLSYELVAKIVSSSQGGAVAVIFCFCNGEIIANVRSSFSDRCRQFPNADVRSSVTFSTHVAAMDSVRGSHSTSRSTTRSSVNSFDRLDRANYIALNAWLNKERGPENGIDA